MTDEVRESYDAMAEQYAALFLNELERDANALSWLARFAELAVGRKGPVADLGCGPGRLVSYLSDLGLATIGYDLSPGQIAEARSAFPDSEFQVGDLAAIDRPDSSLGGIVARYSLIHLLPSRLGDIFTEWMRVLEPRAPVLVSFFGSTSAETHGSPFDHAVVTAYELYPATIAGLMREAGFTSIEIGVRDPPEGGRPFDQGTILAQTP